MRALHICLATTSCVEFAPAARRHIVVVMGPLHTGKPLPWEKIKGEICHEIRDKAILQFINRWDLDRKHGVDRPPLWGDEMEHTLVKFDHNEKKAKLHLRSQTLLSKLNTASQSIWHPEFARYQVESMPVEPYNGTIDGLRQVERSMIKRQERLDLFCADDEAALNLTIFPRICCSNFTDPDVDPDADDDELLSKRYPIDIMYPNPRYRESTRNQAHRLGKKPDFQVPVFQDKRTTLSSLLADSMGACAGFCALQVTIQARDREEARYLYDQFAALGPVLMALTAASPMYAGHLTEFDARFAIQMGTSSDGEYEEMSIGREKIRSRYSSIGCYSSIPGQRFSDVPMPKYRDGERRLLAAGVDEALAEHVSHILSHDPMLVTEDYKNVDEESLGHFNCIQGSVWQTARLKLPVPEEDLGWRVEVRTMEIQLTPFENAAFASFIWLLSKTMLEFSLDFLIPISKLDENVDLAVQRDAINNAELYFTTTCACPGLSNDKSAAESSNADSSTASINEIINGNSSFPGLIPLIRLYLSKQVIAASTHQRINRYLNLISKRASGDILTFAGWARNFVRSHPDYKLDSEVTDIIQYDLLTKCEDIINAHDPCPELLGEN